MIAAAWLHTLDILRADNEPIGGQWPTGLKPAFGDNALGDGQLFWDFRNESAVKWFAEKVILGAVTGEAADAVDGCFIDDPAGYGQGESAAHMVDRQPPCSSFIFRDATPHVYFDVPSSLLVLPCPQNTHKSSLQFNWPQQK